MNRLRRAREEAGYTTKNTAQKMGIHWVTVTRHQSGTLAMSRDTLRRYSDLFGVHIRQLFFHNEELC